MVNLILPKRTRLSQVQILARREGMEHLLHASRDINDWSFHEVARPEWAPLSCHHIFEARDRKSGIAQPWLIDRTQVDASGSFDSEHARIIEAFTASLLWLDQTIKENRARAAAGHHGSLILPTQTNLDIAVRDALHRGDHPNTFK